MEYHWEGGLTQVVLQYLPMSIPGCLLSQIKHGNQRNFQPSACYHDPSNDSLLLPWALLNFLEGHDEPDFHTKTPVTSSSSTSQRSLVFRVQGELPPKGFSLTSQLSICLRVFVCLLKKKSLFVTWFAKKRNLRNTTFSPLSVQFDQPFSQGFPLFHGSPRSFGFRASQL